MEVHGALGLAGRARGESDQADVVRRGVAGREMLVARLLHHRLEAVVAALAPVDDALEIGRDRLRLLHLVGKPGVAQSERDLALGDRVAQLLGAQERHGRNHDRPRLQRREIGRHHHRAVGRAQEDAVSRHQSQIAREHVSDPVHPLGQLTVGQVFGRREQAGPVALARRHPAVQEFGDAVEPVAVAQLRQVEAELRPLCARRQIVPREGVDVARVTHRSVPLIRSLGCPVGDEPFHSAARAAFPVRFFNASRAITIFCTSVAPS
jgi:hypothetical protein